MTASERIALASELSAARLLPERNRLCRCSTRRRRGRSCPGADPERRGRIRSRGNARRARRRRPDAAAPYEAAPTKTGGPPANGYAHTCTLSMPVPSVALRSAAQPPIANGCATSCCARGTSIAICGPTRPLPLRMQNDAHVLARQDALVPRSQEDEIVGADEADARRPRECARRRVELRAGRERRQSRRRRGGIRYDVRPRRPPSASSKRSSSSPRMTARPSAADRERRPRRR